MHDMRNWVVSAPQGRLVLAFGQDPKSFDSLSSIRPALFHNVDLDGPSDIVFAAIWRKYAARHAEQEPMQLG